MQHRPVLSQSERISCVSARSLSSHRVPASIAVSRWQVPALLSTIFLVAAGAQATDGVDGNLILFNDNGAWSWFQDERAVVDLERGRLLIASTANRSGTGGLERDGNVDVTIYELGDGRRRTFTVKSHFTSYGAGDDHNAPALLVLPGGNYLAICAGHNNDTFSYVRRYADDHWSPEQRFDWNSMPGGTDFRTTYSNLFYLSSEDRVYDIARSDDRSPNLMISTDRGSTWSYGGQLTRPLENVGYVNGYFKYSSNGVDRIDFIATEHHPRDFNTGLYHGYLHAGKLHGSNGAVLDDDVSDKTAPKVTELTRVFAADTILEGVKMTRAWGIDLETFSDGTLQAIFSARANDSETDHRFLFARFDGSGWSSTYIAKAGPKLFPSEEDYTGLAALDPNDPDTIYVSTDIDPRSSASLAKHEIFKGVTSDHGRTWSWEPITRDSTQDNLRPIVPAWNNSSTALLWWRGRYISSQNYDAAVVGVIDRKAEKAELVHYTDADATNTTFLDGSALVTTGPSFDAGRDDGRWHRRSGIGNGDSVLSSGDDGSEDAGALKTTVRSLRAGTYDVFSFFWADADEDWRIRAGFPLDDLLLFRARASQRAEAAHFDRPVTVSAGGMGLYRAYVGRVEIAEGAAISVVIDDSVSKAGGHDRTWYDGVGVARVVAVEGETPEHP